jgi:L-asparaginase
MSVATILLATGGTIAYSVSEDRMLLGHELLRVAELTTDRIEDVRSVPSWDLNIDDMLDIASRVCSAIDEGFESVVVTHGTDTMEETAWLTDLLLGPERRASSRVVFTGSMRFSDATDADGPANLRFAYEKARYLVGHGPGVQIAFADHVHAARWAQKIDALELDAFSSHGRPQSSGELPTSTGVIDKQVTMITANSIVRPEIPQGVHGLVVRGTGAAHVPSSYFEPLDQLWKSGVPVVIASRARDVPRAMQPDGRFLWAGDLTPEKAVIALMVGIGATSGKSEITAWWSELLDGAIR